MDLRTVLSPVWRDRWIILATGLVVAVVFAGVSSLIPNQYTATSRMSVSLEGGSTNEELSHGAAFVASQMESYVKLAQSDKIICGIYRANGGRACIAPRGLTVDIDRVPLTTLIDVKVVARSESVARSVADRAVSEVRAAIAVIEPSPTLGSARVVVNDAEPTRMIDETTENSLVRNSALGLLAGLSLALVVSIIRGARVSLARRRPTNFRRLAGERFLADASESSVPLGRELVATDRLALALVGLNGAPIAGLGTSLARTIAASERSVLRLIIDAPTDPGSATVDTWLDREPAGQAPGAVVTEHVTLGTEAASLLAPRFTQRLAFLADRFDAVLVETPDMDALGAVLLAPEFYGVCVVDTSVSDEASMRLALAEGRHVQHLDLGVVVTSGATSA